jgi:AcrR family transcriptional regulator
MSDEIPEHNRRPRADAERNRRRLLDAAATVFGERGLDVGVAEIAQRAGIGHGTLFRNFPSKEDLIAAIVVDQMSDAAERGRELLDSPEPGEALFEFLDEMAGRQQQARALFEALQETFLANREIRAAHSEIVEVLDALLARAQEVGAVRRDVKALDVLFLLKGVCETAAAFQQIDPQISERHLDLVRSALAPPARARMLRGRSPTLGDIERVFAPDPPAPDPVGRAFAAATPALPGPREAGRKLPAKPTAPAPAPRAKTGP